jgi:hypothetical protein
MFRHKFLTITLLVGLLFSQFVPRASAAGFCDWAKFISDVTVSDIASFPPNVPFRKTWRLQNIGTCTWTTGYSLVYYGGERMGAVTSVPLQKAVPPGAMIDISVDMISPSAGGYHYGLWILSNASGTRFGIGTTPVLPIWAYIFVVESNMVAFDFVANAPYAEWKSGGGILPYPGTSGDGRGYALKLDYPKLEDGSFDPQPALLMVPQNRYDGYIQATYPEFLVQQGDQLNLLVNCNHDAVSCYVTFRVNYRLPSGAVRTLWQGREVYEGHVRRANVDLSPLAGQSVKFILMVLATGSTSGDLAVWGAPRILRLGAPATNTPLPPLTPTATAFSTPPVVPSAGCDKAFFVADITVPDGAVFTPNATFSKTWRLKNSGSCTWNTSYSLIFYSGSQLGAPNSVNLPWSIPPGQTVDITVNMVAPASNGDYRGFWILRNAAGTLFGIGRNASDPVWVEINVTGAEPTEMGYDFWKNVCSAQWTSGAGILPCPGVEGDAKGFVINSNFTQLEDGNKGPAPSLLMSPENRYNGYIQGIYPAFTVEPGDRFHTAVGCEYGYKSCYVTFRLDYMSANGSVKTFWTWREQNNGQSNSIDISLNPLAGQSVRFILRLDATGYANGDRVRWVSPFIGRVGLLKWPTVTPPPSLTPEQTGLTIRGYVTLNGVGLPNVKIYRNFASYWGEVVATTDANGYYQSSFVFIPGDETVTVRPELEGYTFSPQNYIWRHYHGVEDRTLDFTASYVLTATPFPDQWPTYTNLQYGFKFKYPNGGEVVTGSNANRARINLPFQAGTNLIEKYLDVVVVENASPCRNQLGAIAQTSENVTINGISFLKESGGEGAAGQVYHWVAYSTLHGNACISLGFVLHAGNPDAYSTPLPLYNESGEMTVFYDIVTQFAWLESTVTPSPTPMNNLLPDLTITAMRKEFQNPGCWLQGDSYGVRISVTNQGQAAATSFMVQVDEAQLPINALGIGETVTLFFPEDKNTVTAIVDPTFLVAESNENNNSHTETFYEATPPLPCTQTPTVTPSPIPTGTPAALQGPYAVTLVALNDVLNVRSGPGVNNPIIGSFAPDATNVMRTGPSQQADGAEWVEVLMPDGVNRGWVNFNYLTEQVSREVFCADTRIPLLIALLKNAVTTSAGASLSSLVSPRHGLIMNYWPSSNSVNYTSATAQTVFTDPQVIDWGSGGGSGIENIGTFAQIVQPQMVDVLNSNYQLNCDALSYGQTYTNVVGYTNTNIHYYSVVKPPTQEFDWKVWLIRIEYVNRTPYLFGAVHYVWEP